MAIIRVTHTDTGGVLNHTYINFNFNLSGIGTCTVSAGSGTSAAAAAPRRLFDDGSSPLLPPLI